MNIILLQASDFTAPDKVCLQGRVVTHINKVLKVGVGQPLKVGLINGPRGVGVVTNLDSKSVELEVALDQPPPEEPKISLLIALPRPQTLKKL